MDLSFPPLHLSRTVHHLRKSSVERVDATTCKKGSYETTLPDQQVLSFGKMIHEMSRIGELLRGESLIITRNRQILLDHFSLSYNSILSLL